MQAAVEAAVEAVARWLSAAVDGPTFWDKSAGWDSGAQYHGSFRRQARELLSLPEVAALFAAGGQET